MTWQVNSHAWRRKIFFYSYRSARVLFGILSDTEIIVYLSTIYSVQESEAEERAVHPKQPQLTSEQKATRGRHSRSSRHANENAQPYADKKSDTASRRSRKRRSTEKMGATMVSGINFPPLYNLRWWVVVQSTDGCINDIHTFVSYFFMLQC